MSYYPTNFYSSYPYNNGNNNQYQYQPQYQMPQAQYQNGLQGKIVENIDVVKVTDVPMGGYGIFPKADFSEIYIKTWNGNGTTSILSFQPVISQEAEKEGEKGENIILEKIQKLEDKIDMIAGMSQQALPAPTSASQNSIRKEF